MSDSRRLLVSQPIHNQQTDLIYSAQPAGSRRTGRATLKHVGKLGMTVRHEPLPYLVTEQSRCCHKIVGNPDSHWLRHWLQAYYGFRTKSHLAGPCIHSGVERPTENDHMYKFQILIASRGLSVHSMPRPITVMSSSHNAHVKNSPRSLGSSLLRALVTMRTRSSFASKRFSRI